MIIGKMSIVILIQSLLLLLLVKLMVLPELERRTSSYQPSECQPIFELVETASS